MEIISFLLDFILHVDKHLEAFVQSYGVWVYALLFLIIFVETGVVVMPFLPGDSLLFVVGAMCGVGLMSYPLSVGLLFAAAVLGNQSNYTIGHYFGPKVFRGKTRAFSTRRPLTRPTSFTKNMAASPSWRRVSCLFCAPLRRLWPVWRR